MPDQDRALGALLGLAVGDALGMPIDGLAHQNVRLYYKGIKEYRDDEKRGDLVAGQWTARTQRTFALVRALTAHPDDPVAVQASFQDSIAAQPLRRDPTPDGQPHALVAAGVAPLGILWTVRGWDEREAFDWVQGLFPHEHAETKAAAYGQAFAVHVALVSALESQDGLLVVEDIAEEIEAAEAILGGDRRISDKLRVIAPHLDEVPLDLQDRLGGTGLAADEAFPFALAMFARNPSLVEGTLLSAVNVGGAAATVGALAGALLGAHVGWSAFPDDWREGVEEGDRLEDEARALLAALRG